VRAPPETLVPSPVRQGVSRIAPGWLRTWWESRWLGLTAYERWGYRVWGTVAVAIAVPEIWAAVAGHGPWPTISGTTGHLEDLWSPTAILVVAAIVIAAARALGFGPQRPGARDDAAAVEPGSSWWPYAYFAIALVCVGVPSGLVAAYAPEGPESRFVLGYVLYGLIGFFGLFVPAVIGWVLAFFFAVNLPFPPLFSTIKRLEKRLPVFALVVVAGLVILLIHLALYPWPDISHHHPGPGSL
jgi:hypothetical protein